MKRKLLSVILTLTMSLSFAGCSKTANDDTLDIYLFGEGLKQMQPVLDEFYARTQDELGIKLNFTMMVSKDYREKMKMSLASGEEMDLVFDAPWMNLNKLASDGAYLDLSEYFHNPEYPGLEKAFSKEFIDNNRINGKVYAIPMTQSFYDVPGLLIRKDIREKLGISEIKTDNDLKALFDAILASDSNMTPLAVGTRGFYKMFSDEQLKATTADVYEIQGVVSGTAVAVEAAISRDGKTVLGVAVYGDDQSKYSDFPAPYNTPNYKMFETYRDWNKYLETDSIAQIDAKGYFEAGKAAAMEGTINDVAASKEKIAQLGGEVEFYPYFKEQREMKEGAVNTEYKAWNFMCVPATSKKVEKTMRFLDWLFASQENHDLFQYGIEGTNWVAVGNDQYKYPDGVKQNENYNFPAYEMGWNPNYIRLPAGLPDEVTGYLKYQTNEKTYSKSKIAGFTFNPEPVQTELALMQAAYDKVYLPLMHGKMADPKTSLETFKKEASAGGLDKIREEIKSQLQTHLDTKNK